MFSRDSVLLVEINEPHKKQSIEKYECMNITIDFLVSFTRSFDDESNNVRIPCEYCNVSISMNDWMSHSVDVDSS